jgi:hypothetical protein
MLPIVEFPEIVRHYAPWFRTVFSAEAMIEFERYVSGLILSENKTVEGINKIIVCEQRNQSSLNRLLTESPFSEKALNEKRLALLNSLPGTQMKARKGVLGLDDTLLSHYGQHFEQIAKLWDSANECWAWAHNLVNLYYSDDQTDYPVQWQLWKPADLAKIEAGLVAAGIKLRMNKLPLKQSDPKKWRQYLLGVWSRHQAQETVAVLYESKLLIARQILSEWVKANAALHLPVTFDHWYTQPGFCRFLTDELKLRYVGTLSDDNKIFLKTGLTRLDVFAEQLKKEHLQAIQNGHQLHFHKITIPYKGETESYYSYCRTLRVHNFGKQRVVINFRKPDLSDSPVFYNSNCLHWQATGITRIRRHRWPVEVYHQEGKAEGLDQYQVRDFQAISRHIALVAVTYSLLRAAPHDPILLHKLHALLKLDLEATTAGWRRIAQADSLVSLASLIATGLAQHRSLHEILHPLLTALCA